MKSFLVGLFVCLLVATAFGGGPDIEIVKAHVDDVVISEEDYVTLRVTGTAVLTVLKASEDGSSGPREVKEITMPIKSGEIRYQLSIEPFNKIERPDQRNEALLKLKGTYQHIQMFGSTAIIEHYTVTHITAAEIGVYPPSKKEMESAAVPVGEVKPQIPPSSPRTR